MWWGNEYCWRHAEAYVAAGVQALFRALKTKHETPKYGLIYHASLIGQAAPKNKGKMSRILAAKASLATRVDAMGTSDDATIGIDSRTKVPLPSFITGLSVHLPYTAFGREGNRAAPGAAASACVTYRRDSTPSYRAAQRWPQGGSG